MAEGKIALQLMTLREVCTFGAKGLLADGVNAGGWPIYGVGETFRRVRELGIRDIELSKVAVTDETLAEMQAACREYGMHVLALTVICASHLEGEPGDQLDRDFDKIVARCHALGASYVRVGMLPRRCLNSRDEYLRAAAEFDGYGRRLLAEGIHLYLHNHHYEFQRFGDKFGLELLAENTDPAHVGFELDTHWVQRGGQDPAKWIRRLAGRVDLLHLKDYRIQPPPSEQVTRATLQGCIEFAEIGAGNLDWPEIFAAAKEAGVVYYPIEQDVTYGRNPYDCLADSVHNLRAMGLGALLAP